MTVTAQQVRQVRAGGAAPFLIRAMPYLLGLARIQALAAAGNAGVVFLPEFLGEEYGLKNAQPEESAFELPLWLAFHEDLRNSSKVRVVLDFLVEGLTQVQAV